MQATIVKILFGKKRKNYFSTNYIDFYIKSSILLSFTYFSTFERNSGIDYSFAHQNSNRSGTRLPRCFVKSREKRERVLFSIYEARFPRRVFPFYHGPSFEQTYSPIFSERGTAKLALSPPSSPLFFEL